MRPTGLPSCLLIVVLGSALLGLACWTADGIAAWGHARALRKLKEEWRLRPPPKVWSPSLTWIQIQALDLPATRQRTIERMDLGPPTEVRGPIREYARTIPLRPSWNGREREIEIIREEWGMSSKHEWRILEDGVEVDSGSFAFFFCG